MTSFSCLQPKPTFVEGDLFLKDLKYTKLSKSKLFLFIICTILTAGAMLLITYWSKRLRIWFFYSYVSTLSKATHFELLEWDDEIEYVKKTNRLVYDPETGESTYQICFVNRNLLYVVNPEDNTCSAVELSMIRPFLEFHQKAKKPLDHKNVISTLR